MSRVLLVCPEPLGHRHPAGIGIRFLEMAKALRDDGHGVTLLSPDDGLTAERLLRESSEADLAVLQGHVSNDFFAHARAVPTVVDLYDPFIIENLHYYAARGAEVFTHDHATLMSSLVRGDFFLCASEAQRLFYLGLLLAAGRLNPATFENDPALSSLIAVAPFGVPPPRPRNATREGERRVLFGGIYDWYDPILAIDAVAAARRSLPDLTLTFTLHPNPALTPQGKTAEAMQYVKRSGAGDFVRFEPWFEYERRGEFFDRFAIALLTFPRSLETELSMRTRVYDYLWGDLPIVTSSAPGTDDILMRYDAGIVVQSSDAAAFAEALVRAIQQRDRMAAGAERFVREHQWKEALAPLLEFARRPRFDANKELFAVRMQVPERPASILERLKRRIGGSS